MPSLKRIHLTLLLVHIWLRYCTYMTGSAGNTQQSRPVVFVTENHWPRGGEPDLQMTVVHEQNIIV